MFLNAKAFECFDSTMLNVSFLFEYWIKTTYIDSTNLQKSSLYLTKNWFG